MELRTMNFEPGPANPQPLPIAFDAGPPFDPLDGLPAGAADRLRALRQRASDAHSVIPKFEDVHELSTSRMKAEQRLKRLLDHQQDGGFHLDPTDRLVIEAQRRLETLTADLKRINELNEARSEAWRTASGALQNVEAWLRDGRPHGTVLEAFNGPDTKLNKGEGVTDAIERLRRRGRELKADLHRIRSAPFPSGYCKAQIKQQIEILAQAGAPAVNDVVERDGKIVWPTQQVRSTVYNAEPGTIAFAEISDAIALFAWLHRDALIKRIDAEIDAASDDAAALTHEVRQRREAGVMDELLAVERDETVLVIRAQAQGMPVEHRSDINPVALLGVQLVTAPGANPSPVSSLQHAFNVTFPGRR
jgi:hypothetical protein